jgi:outer membrane protein assembly factor BamE (lipoprotein component of BamABCDE complex)
MQKRTLAFILLITPLLPACMSHPTDMDTGGATSNLTVGKVQGEIKIGMSAAEVAGILGSPNIVTTDEKRREVWIYDKVSSSSVDTKNSAYGTLIIFGASTSQNQSNTSQKTLTVIIKYDENKLVRDFAYNYSQF